MQAEFQCSYSLQLLLGNQQQILTVHFHVSPFAFPLGRVLVLLQRLGLSRPVFNVSQTRQLGSKGVTRLLAHNLSK